jgi:hypothetical protein
MSEFLHHVVANREYMQRDMSYMSEANQDDVWGISIPVPYSIANSGNEALAEEYRRLVIGGGNNG